MRIKQSARETCELEGRCEKSREPELTLLIIGSERMKLRPGILLKNDRTAGKNPLREKRVVRVICYWMVRRLLRGLLGYWTICRLLSGLPAGHTAGQMINQAIKRLVIGISLDDSLKQQEESVDLDAHSDERITD